MSRCIFIMLLTLIPLSLTIPNCIKNSSPNECEKCVQGYVLQKNKTCLQCFDQNCMSCLSANKHSCLTCNPGFVIANKQCGLSCNSIPNCDTCSFDSKECIHCRSSCKITQGQCTCESKVIGIIIGLVISFIVVIVVVFCLTFTSLSRKNKLVQLALSGITNEADIIQNSSIVITEDDINYHSDKKNNRKIKRKAKYNNHEPQQLTIISTETNLPESLTEEKSLCNYCLVEISIERLSCGCHLCSRHHTLFKNKTGNNKCPLCHKEVNNIEVLRCGICKIISTYYNQLHCQCELQVCDNCFKDQEKNDYYCSNCIKSLP